MANAYADLDTLKSPAVLNLTGSTFDSRLLALLEDVSRWIDTHCNRHFFVLTATRRFDGPGGTQLRISDLISLTTLSSDEDQDRVFEITWSSSDFLLYPLNAEPLQPWGRPYSRILVDVAAGSRASFPFGPSTVEITGRWGFREETQDSGADINEGATFSASDTLLTVTDGTRFAPGKTVLIDTEQLYITAISGNVLTVSRGVNGTAAATHSDGTDISIFDYPGPVVEAYLLRTSRLWRSRDPGEIGGNPGRTDLPGVDPDVQRLLSSYRRAPLGVGS